MEPRRKVLVIYTGGTMGMIFDNKVNSLVPFDVKQIQERIPELQRLGIDLDFISFEKPMDSSNVGPEHWLYMARIVYDYYAAYDGFVILHGTDTMAYSASALSFLLENLAKPVIFTGAQLPISEVRSDARENFITAAEIAGASKGGKPVVQEVCIYFDYLLLRGNRSRKMQSAHFDAFLSENYPPLAKAGVSIEYFNNYFFTSQAGAIKLYDNLVKDIAVLKLFPGISEALVHSVLNTPGLRGVILETFGSGNAPTDDYLINALEKAISNGVIIYNVSQCVGGTVEQGRYATSKRLAQIGVISGGDITTEAAVVKLMFLLGNDPYKEEVDKWLNSSLRGEKD